MPGMGIFIRTTRERGSGITDALPTGTLPTDALPTDAINQVRTLSGAKALCFLYIHLFPDLSVEKVGTPNY